MSTKRRRRETFGELLGRYIFYGFMVVIVAIVCFLSGVAIADGFDKVNIDAYANNENLATMTTCKSTENYRLAISPTSTPTPIPTATCTPTPSPLPTNTPTPTPGNFWGCEHRCDSEGRYYDIELEAEYQVYIHDICEKIGVPFELGISTCWRESTYSNGDYNINDDGTRDVGLFQINECNWEWFKEIFGESWDPYDPYDSIDAGLYYIQYCMEFDKDPRVFMMVYNMGPTGAREKWDQGIWSTEYSRSLYNYMTKELPLLKIIED